MFVLCIIMTSDHLKHCSMRLTETSANHSGEKGGWCRIQTVRACLRPFRSVLLKPSRFDWSKQGCFVNEKSVVPQEDRGKSSKKVSLNPSTSEHTKT